LVVPIVTAIVLYLILRPIVRQACRFGVPPAIAAAAVLFTLLIALGLATYLVFQPARTAIAAAPRHLAVIKEKLSFLTERLQQINEATETIAETTEEEESPVGDEEPVPVEIKQPAWASNVSYLTGTG